MDGHLILKRDHPQVASVKFGADAPEAEAIIFLRLVANWILNNADAPLLPEIRSLAKNFVLEIFGEMKFGHVATDIGMARRTAWLLAPESGRQHHQQGEQFQPSE